MKITPELIQRLRDTIINVINKGVTDFYDGGALGWDQLCAETVISLKAECRRQHLSNSYLVKFGRLVFHIKTERTNTND